MLTRPKQAKSTIWNGSGRAKWTITKGEWHFKVRWLSCIDAEEQLYVEDGEEQLAVVENIVQMENGLDLEAATIEVNALDTPRGRNAAKARESRGTASATAHSAGREALKLTEEDRMRIVNSGLNHFSVMGHR